MDGENTNTRKQLQDQIEVRNKSIDFCSIEYLRSKYEGNSLKNPFSEALFKLKLFFRFNNTYYYRTPDSDSLYRRRNRLLLLLTGLVFYFATEKKIFNKEDFQLVNRTIGQK